MAQDDASLTQEAIAKMTHPLTQPAAQIRYLRKIGIRAERRPDGKVLVLWAWLAQPANDGAEFKPRLKSDRPAA